MVRYEIRNWILKVQAHFLSEKQWGVKNENKTYKCDCSDVFYDRF